MRVALYAAAGLLFTGAGTLAYLGVRPVPTPPPPPSFTITPSRHDFGERSRTETVTAKFAVTNTHPVPLTVGPIVKGCSCSSAEVSPNPVPANSVAELTIVWNLRGKRGRSAESASIPYSGDGGITGHQMVQVTADVHGVIDADVEVLELSDAKRVGEIGFASKIGREFQLVGAATNHPSLVATVLPNGKRVRVTFDPAVSGWESGRLLVSVVTDQADEREMRVLVLLK